MEKNSTEEIKLAKEHAAEKNSRKIEVNESIQNALELVVIGAKNVHDFFNRKDVQYAIQKIHYGLIGFSKLITNFYQYSQNQKKMYINMSSLGWFPSYMTFVTPTKEEETADEFMERCITEKYDEIKEILYGYYPQRKLVLEEAFKLYEEERYISAIPLFISQIDGVSEDGGFSCFFSGDHSVSSSVKKNLSAAEKSKLKKFPVYLREALESKFLGESQELVSFYEEVIINASNSFIGESTHKTELSNPINFLNRHGIMHGHIDFINYGTKTNTLKILSLLLFVNHMVSLINGDSLNDEDKTIEADSFNIATS